MPTSSLESGPAPQGWSRLKLCAWALFYTGFGGLFLSRGLHALLSGQTKAPFTAAPWTWTERPVVFSAAIVVLALIAVGNFLLAWERVAAARRIGRSA
jgi:hypothetical protein